ncbi:GRAS family transcription factor [Striga asiatica]|uniref:GRAS family transcription factor n=1 Tax=Striga asiatica TaxID=4170 RepID=A0A5A7QMJ7_STRAF|nr:GRAS family transcription factor [Striga asiatica]
MDLTLRLFNYPNGFLFQNQSEVGSVGSNGHSIGSIDLNSFPDNDESLTIASSNAPNIVTDKSSSESRVVWDFGKGISRSLPIESDESSVGRVFSLEDNAKCGPNEVNVKKTRFGTGEERKLPDVCNESNEDFDDVVYTLDRREEELAAYMSGLQITASKSVVVTNEKISSNKKKSKTKTKKKKNEETIDYTALLIGCAESISSGDLPKAKQMLGKIRQHSSICGDAGQRVAHYFAEGLEARAFGTTDVRNGPGPSDYLKAHCMSVVFSPFRRILNFASNYMIAARSVKSARIHVIDFGISFDFQWPILIRRLASRGGGPPTALRITGIDFPLPGPRPAERVDEMGRRLARYAEAHGVPFEYKSVARAWGDVTRKDLEIRSGEEFVVVNLSERAKTLPDEMNAAFEKSRANVLELIREAKPDIFVQGVVNGSHGNSFFLSRFREALFHYSVVFDMLETTGGNGGGGAERMVVERDVIWKEVMNVVACEGWERVERPETYRQWHGRNVRAGFKQVALEKGLMGELERRLKGFYHKEHVIVEENRWLLMSWKGRTLYALSFWRPAG